MFNFIYILFLFFSGLVVPVCVSFAGNDFDSFFRNQKNYDDVVVARVLRANVIELESGEKIHLIGLKAPTMSRSKETPERDKYGFVVQPEISAETPMEEVVFYNVRDMLLGKHVRLEFDVEKTDEDHYTYGYVFLKDMFVNAEILRLGYADLSIAPPNMKYADQLRAAYREAHQEKRGLQDR